jgi:hypothetical protein
MNFRSIFIWTLLVISLFCLLLLYGITNPGTALIDWIDEIAESLLIIILLLVIVFLSTKTTKHKILVIIMGAAVSAATAIITWYRYIVKLKESLKSIKDYTEPKLFIGIGVFLIILGLMANYRKKKD